MITLLVGKKGSGKTKKLVEAANAAVESTNGNVVVIERESKLTLEISHQARLVALDPYGVSGMEALYGFLSGICAGNYDVKEIFVDSTLSIIGNDMDTLATFIDKVDKLANFAETKVTFSISADESEIPHSVKAVATPV